jgi:hypothetical protein
VELTPTLRLNLPAFAYEPWDDEVNDNFDVLDAFVGSVVGFANYAGIWTNATSYTVGQQVIDTTDSSFWGCNISHTSAAAPTSFIADRAAHPTYWGLRQNSAKQYAEQAAASASAAAASAAAAQAAYAAIMPDAPRNGIMYGRIDGTWQQAVAIDSPFFTGDPRAPTPLLSDNDNSIATTAFVKGLVGTSAAFVSIGDTPPASPSIGSLWWDDIGGQLYVYYRDVDTYQWVAVNSATGGMGTGFMPIVGGNFTGPVMMFRDPLNLTEAATKRYVDNTVNNKTYPYLLLTSVPSQTVTSPVAITGTLSVSSTLTAGGALNVTGNIAGNIISAGTGVPSGMLGGSFNGQQIHITNGVCYNLYWSVNDGQWHYRAAGGGALAYFDTNPSAPTYNIYTAPNGGAGAVAGISTGFYINGTDVVANRTFTCTGNIWATNRGGAFGLQDFGGGVWGMRFATDGWRLQWNSNNGQMSFINNLGTNLWNSDGSGNTSCAGQFVCGTGIYCYNGVAFGSQNGWEYHTYVEGGSGDHIVYHRTGNPGEAWYERWSSSGGASHWIKGTVEVMSLDGGTLWARDKIFTGGTVQGGWVYSTGQVRADSDFYSPSGTCHVGGDVSGSAIYGPNGMFCGGVGDTGYGFYRSGNDKIWQSIPNCYWRHQSGTNNKWWTWPDGSPFWAMYGNGETSGLAAWCLNSKGRVGGYGPYGDFSDARLKTDIEDTHYGSAEIMQLRPKSFIRKRRTDDAPEPQREIGFVAQDVQRVLPEAVTMVELDGEPTLIFSDSVVIAALVNAYKELSARVVAMEARHGA